MCQTSRGNKSVNIRLNHDALVLTSQMPSQPARNFRIVERSFSHAILLWKCNRVGPNRLVRSTAHHRDNAGRIEAGAEKRSNGNVADHLCFDRSAKALANFFRQIRFRSRVGLIRSRKRQIPILRELKFVPCAASRNGPQEVSGSGETSSSDRAPRGTSNIGAAIRGSSSAWISGTCNSALISEANAKRSAIVKIIKGLHSEVITRHEQLWRGRRADRKSRRQTSRSTALRNPALPAS